MAWQDDKGKRKKLLEIFSLKKCVIVLIVLYMIAFVEVIALRYYSIEVYPSTVFISLFLFFTSLHCRGEHPNFFSWMGKNLSAYIYLFHGACKRIVECFNVEGGLKPIFVILISVLISFLLYKIRQFIRNEKF